MRILFLGDVVGHDGRRAVVQTLPDFIRRHSVDFTVIDGDNAAHGFGLTSGVCKDFFEAGADVITTGNHGFAQADFHPYLNVEPRVLRPANLPAGAPGSGCGFYRLKDGRAVAVMHLQARTFMDMTENPFLTARDWTERVRLGIDVQANLIDVHGEATSEKMALGHYCDGKVSFVVGTHTHIPTADAQILNGGTAYMTDAGMCGCFDSVIGMDKEEPIRRFVTNMRRDKYTPAKGDVTVCGAFVETDDKTGLAQKICAVRYGGRLEESLPSF